MANITLRNSVMGIKAETTEGTYVPPASNTDYVALQPDAAIVPVTEELTNDELTGSIGISKPILGLENPTASFSSYLKNSGSSSVPPEAGPIYKALFGAETIDATEYDTIAGSTTSAINLDVGEGTGQIEGRAWLIKDGSNGYSIRAAHSISGDTVNLGFVLDNAPASGVNTGKAVTYSPTNENHDTLSLSYYAGNQGAHTAMAGSRPVGYDITADAGQLINGSFSFEGTKFFFNPITITSSTKYLDFTSDNGTYAAILEEKTYKDPEQLASAIQTAMAALDTAETYSVVYNSKGTDAGKFTISTSTSTLLSLLWNTGANTANTIATKIGFDSAADDTGSTEYTSDNLQDWGAPHDPIVYDAQNPIAAKAHEVMLGDGTDNTCIKPSTLSISPANTKANINDICSESGVDSSLITAREVSISFTAILPQHCVENFARYRRGDQLRFQYTFGTKADGTNWDAGKSGCFYSPSCVITAITIENEDDIARMSVEMKCFEDPDREGSFFLSFV